MNKYDVLIRLEKQPCRVYMHCSLFYITDLVYLNYNLILSNKNANSKYKDIAYYFTT